MNLEQIQRKTDIDFLMSLCAEFTVEPPPRLISEYIENRRIMPGNTPFPGPVDLGRTAYGTEIMDCMSPYNPTQYVDVMSASQVIKTFTEENIVGYYMGALPAAILFMSGTDNLLKKWATKRLEPLIDSLGIRPRFRAPVDSTKTRRTGDTTYQKLYDGGFLEMASAQSPSSQRSDSIRILVMDELDSAPPQLVTGEGYWDENSEARTKAWGNRRKILACSTTTDYQTSTIFRRYSLGDQCEYLVPCPLCGKHQYLKGLTEQDGGNHGVRADTQNGEVKQIYYLCEFCHNAIFEHQKNTFIPAGKWEPTAKPEYLRRSFHMNSLLSPLGMYSWRDYWTSWEKAKRTPDGLKNFTNHQDGRPYVDRGTRPDSAIVIENRGKYRAGEVPEGVLYLTAFVDVQRGSSTNPDNPPRLEMEVLGIGRKYRTWSIEYKVFEGAVDDPYSGSFEKLFQYIMTRSFQYQRKIDGFTFPVALLLVDSGDGETTDVVYRFCKRFTNAFPSKGMRAIYRRKKEAPDELTEGTFKRYRAVKIDEDTILYEISTVYYKNNVYNNLKIEREPGKEQRPGFCDFPVDYDQKYFDGLTAEEKMADGSYNSKGRMNEPLDCRVGCLCGGDIFLDSEVFAYKGYFKEQGYNSAQLQGIDWNYVLSEMERQTAVKK